MINIKTLKITALIVTFLLFSAASSETLDEITYSKSVVLIRGVHQDFNHITPWKQTAMSQGLGSGFIIEGNRILTNAHNVANYKYVELKKQNLAKRYPATVSFVGHDCGEDQHSIPVLQFLSGASRPSRSVRSPSGFLHPFGS